MKAEDIELRIASYFCYRQNLIVPNVWWGLGLAHEADILIVSKAGYATEVEIKITMQDLKADKKKTHQHKSDIIKRLYFAIPESMDVNEALLHIPEHAGLITVGKHITRVREAKAKSKAKKLTNEELTHLAHLGCMRMWSLKTKLNNYRKRINKLTNEIEFG